MSTPEHNEEDVALASMNFAPRPAEAPSIAANPVDFAAIDEKIKAGLSWAEIEEEVRQAKIEALGREEWTRLPGDAPEAARASRFAMLGAETQAEAQARLAVPAAEAADAQSKAPAEEPVAAAPAAATPRTENPRRASGEPARDPDGAREALEAMAARVLGENGKAPRAAPTATVAAPEPGHVAAGGQQQLGNGVASLVGGAAALAGSLARGAGAVADTAASAIHAGVNRLKGGAPAAPDLINVPRRLTEYRVAKLDESASSYDAALKEFWNAGALPAVRREVQERARQTGVSVEDVMAKMKPGGEFADLHEKFVNAVRESPDAQTHQKAMDKALTAWTRQYDHAHTEMLTPAVRADERYPELSERIDDSRERMLTNSKRVPLFEDEDKTHAEKLVAALERIIAAIRRIGESLMHSVQALRGPKQQPEEEHAAAP